MPAGLEAIGGRQAGFGQGWNNLGRLSAGLRLPARFER